MGPPDVREWCVFICDITRDSSWSRRPGRTPVYPREPGRALPGLPLLEKSGMPPGTRSRHPETGCLALPTALIVQTSFGLGKPFLSQNFSLSKKEPVRLDQGILS